MELEDDFQFRPKSDEIDYSLESTLSVYYLVLGRRYSWPGRGGER